VTPGAASALISFNAAEVSGPVTTSLTVTFDGVTESLPVKVEPGPWKFTLPTTMTSGQTAQGTIMLAGAPDVPVTIHLQSPPVGFTVTPASITIPAGQTSAAFTITALPVTTSTKTTIFATAGNASLYSPLIDVTP
jgi:hypothetical protein